MPECIQQPVALPAQLKEQISRYRQSVLPAAMSLVPGPGSDGS